MAKNKTHLLCPTFVLQMGLSLLLALQIVQASTENESNIKTKQELLTDIQVSIWPINYHSLDMRELKGGKSGGGKSRGKKTIISGTQQKVQSTNQQTELTYQSFRTYLLEYQRFGNFRQFVLEGSRDDQIESDKDEFKPLETNPSSIS